MELAKTSFDKLSRGRELLFRNERHLVIHATKVDHTVIVNHATLERVFTGQYHEVWEIDPRDPQRG